MKDVVTYILAIYFAIMTGANLGYWNWYITNWNNMTSDGTAGAIIGGIILGVLSLIVMPYVIKEVLNNN